MIQSTHKHSYTTLSALLSTALSSGNRHVAGRRTVNYELYNYGLCERLVSAKMINQYSLKSGHSGILKMFHLTFTLLIYIVFNHWHALKIDLQST